MSGLLLLGARDQVDELVRKVSVISLGVEGIEARASWAAIEPELLTGLRCDGLEAWRPAQDLAGYLGRVASRAEWQEYSRNVNGGPDDYAPTVVCAHLPGAPGEVLAMITAP